MYIFNETLNTVYQINNHDYITNINSKNGVGYGRFVRCSYYDNVDDPQAEGITNCDCTDEGFRCRPATDFAFSF
jgi:hypothetical protein